MREFNAEIEYTCDAVTVALDIIVEYDVYGSYEAASFDSEGCEPELSFEAYDSETGSELPDWIMSQVEEELSEQAWAHFEKECEDDAACHAAEMADGA